MSALQVSCEGHRLQDSASVEFVDIQSPFSNFDFVEKRFAKSQTIHRCFSLARSANCCCCVVEPLVDVGLLDDDTKEMRRLGYHVATTNYRLSFWKNAASSKQEFNALAESDLFGYMIVRCDGLDPADPQWYVFEAVLSKYDHPHNCVSMPGEYNLAVCGRNFRMRGVMFCQQNKLNKRCAQVSLRALLSRIVPERDVAYSRINAIAARVAKSSGETFNPSDGMSVMQIEQVLRILEFDTRMWIIRELRKVRKSRRDLRRRSPIRSSCMPVRNLVWVHCWGSRFMVGMRSRGT